MHEFALKQYNKHPNLGSDDSALLNPQRSTRSVVEDEKKNSIKTTNATIINRNNRDIMLAEKYLELGLVLSHDMFEKRPNTSRSDIVNDAIQIINCLDLYFRHSARTRISLTYLETWASKDRIEISRDVKKTLYNFYEYVQRRLYMVHKDAIHLITGGHSTQFEFDELGMSIPDSICTAKAVSVSQEASIYEPFVVGSIMAHMIGHNLGMEHDSTPTQQQSLNNQPNEPSALPIISPNTSKSSQAITSIPVVNSSQKLHIMVATSKHKQQNGQIPKNQPSDSELGSLDAPELESRSGRSTSATLGAAELNPLDMPVSIDLGHELSGPDGSVGQSNNGTCKTGCLMSHKFTYVQPPVSFGHISVGSSHNIKNNNNYNIGDNFPSSNDNNTLNDDDDSLSEDEDPTMSTNQQHSQQALPFKFSRKSLDTYHRLLRMGQGMCLWNKPNQIEDFKLCGNGIVDRDEQCDCGTFQQCEEAKDQCCDPITCRFHGDAECISGPCCDRCRLKPSGTACRKSRNECDLTEWCDGRSSACPADLHKADGRPCTNGFCLQGSCPSHDDQCADIWGQDSKSADMSCYTTFNTIGNIRGNCGYSPSQSQSQVASSNKNSFRRCELADVLCGNIQCKSGDMKPLFADYQAISNVAGADNDNNRYLGQHNSQHNTITYSRKFTQLSPQPAEGQHECKSINGHHLAHVRDGIKCGDSKMCLNKTCIPVELAYRESFKLCPRDEQNNECSANGWCSSAHRCHCEPGWTGHDCSQIISNNEHNNNYSQENASQWNVVNVIENQSESNRITTTPASSLTSNSYATATKTTTTIPPIATTNGKLLTNGAEKSAAQNLVPNPQPTMPPSPEPIKKKAEGLGRTHLVLILVTIVAAVYIGFALMANCYRRDKFYKPDKVLRHHQMSCKLESMRSSFIERRLADAKANGSGPGAGIDHSTTLQQQQNQHLGASHNGPWATSLCGGIGSNAPLLANDEAIDFITGPMQQTNGPIGQTTTTTARNHSKNIEPQKIAATVHYYTTGRPAASVSGGAGAASGGNTDLAHLDQTIFDVDRIPLVNHNNGQQTLNSRFHLIPLEQSTSGIIGSNPSNEGNNDEPNNNNQTNYLRSFNSSGQIRRPLPIFVDRNSSFSTRSNTQQQQAYTHQHQQRQQPQQLPQSFYHQQQNRFSRNQRQHLQYQSSSGLNRAISLGNVNNHNQQNRHQQQRSTHQSNQPQSFTTICWPSEPGDYYDNMNHDDSLINDIEICNNDDHELNGYASDEEPSYDYFGNNRTRQIPRRPLSRKTNHQSQQANNRHLATTGSSVHRAFATPLRGSASPRRSQGSLGRNGEHRIAGISNIQSCHGTGSKNKSFIGIPQAHSTGNHDDSYSAPSSPEIRANHQHHQHVHHHQQQRASFINTSKQHQQQFNHINIDNEDPMLMSSINCQRRANQLQANASNLLTKRPIPNLALRDQVDTQIVNLNSLNINRRQMQSQRQANNKILGIGRHQSMDDRQVVIATERLSSLDGDAEEDDDDPLSELPLPPPPLQANANDENDDGDVDVDVDDEYEISSQATELDLNYNDKRTIIDSQQQVNQRHQLPNNTSDHDGLENGHQKPVSGHSNSKNSKRQQLTLNDLGCQASLLAQLQQLNRAQSSNANANSNTNPNDTHNSVGGENLHDFFSLPLIVQLSTLLAKSLQSDESKQSSTTATSVNKPPSSIPIDDLLNILNLSNKSYANQQQPRPMATAASGSVDQQQNKLNNLQDLIKTLQKLDSNQATSSQQATQSQMITSYPKDNITDNDNRGDFDQISTSNHQNHLTEDASPTTSNDATIVSREDDKTIIARIPKANDRNELSTATEDDSKNENNPDNEPLCKNDST